MSSHLHFCILFTPVYAQLLSSHTMCINPHYHANMMLGQCPVSLSISFPIASLLVLPFHPCQSKQMATLYSWDCCHFIINVEGWVSLLFECAIALWDVLGWGLRFSTLEIKVDRFNDWLNDWCSVPLQEAWNYPEFYVYGTRVSEHSSKVKGKRLI